MIAMMSFTPTPDRAGSVPDQHPGDDSWSEPTHTSGGAHAAQGPDDDAHSPAAVSQQLLAEQLQQLAQALINEHGHLSHDGLETLMRIVRFAQRLKELHAVDRRGRCRLCREQQRWWSRRHLCAIHLGLTDVFGRIG